MAHFLKRFMSDNKGGLAVVGAFTAAGMATMVGIASDQNRIVSATSKLQNALDTAVLAVANSKDGSIANAKSVFEDNAADVKSTNRTVSIIPGTTGQYLGEATADVPLIFSALIGRSSSPIRVTSSAKKGTAPSQMCILALDKGCGPNIILNGGAKINGSACEIHAQSPHNYTSIINRHVELNVSRMCVKADKMVNNGPHRSNVEMSCSTVSDPYKNSVAQPNPGQCDYRSKNYSKQTVNLKPGTYCGHFNFNSSRTKVNFAPGTYIFKRSKWNVNGGEWSGDGVTFYFNDRKSGIQFNSGVKADITAPEEGPFAGFVMAEKKGLRTSNMVLNDSRGFDAEGIIYLPSRNMTFNGRSSLKGRRMSLIVNALRVNSATIDIKPVDSDPGSEGNVGYASLEQ